MFLELKSYNLKGKPQKRVFFIMISEDQLYRLIAENESLQVQIKELNEILAQREEELELLKENASRAAELRSMLDVQLDELQAMQNHLGQKQQQVEGAAERELELELELTEAAKSQQMYNDLVQQYAYTESQLVDIQVQLSELDSRNRQLLKIAGRIGELESNLANTLIERDVLKTRISMLENSPTTKESMV